VNVFLKKIEKTQLAIHAPRAVYQGEGSGKTPMARHSRVASLTMTVKEPALSLPKGRRKLERSIWTFYA
jgi:hypothetical protein